MSDLILLNREMSLSQFKNQSNSTGRYKQLRLCVLYNFVFFLINIPKQKSSKIRKKYNHAHIICLQYLCPRRRSISIPSKCPRSVKKHWIKLDQ